MGFFNFLSRSQAEENPQEFKEVLDKLCKLDITFEPRIFEYRGRDDFIFYKLNPENNEVTFAMKVLCTEVHFKVTKVYYRSQVDLFICFCKLRTAIVENRETEIDQGIIMNIMWSADICTEDVKNFAMLANLMEENNADHKITKSNKNLYYGKDIVFQNSISLGFSQPQVPNLTQTGFAQSPIAQPQVPNLTQTGFAQPPLAQPQVPNLTQTGFTQSPLARPQVPNLTQTGFTQSPLTQTGFTQSPLTQTGFTQKPNSTFSSFSTPSTSFTKPFTSFTK